MRAISFSLTFLGLIVATCNSQSVRDAGSDASTHGSIGVAVIRKDTIVVATESRTRTDGRLNPDTACKMTIVGNTVFSAAGLLKGSASALQIVDFARSVLAGDERIEEKMNAFQTGASQLLTSWVNIRSNLDSLTSSPVFRNEHALHAMFCFFSRGRPVVVKYDFVPWFDGKQFKIRGAYDAGARNPGEFVCIGEYESTQSRLLKDSAFAQTLVDHDAPRAAESIIRQQTVSTPEMVGGPIDIAVLTPQGAVWLQKKQNCY